MFTTIVVVAAIALLYKHRFLCLKIGYKIVISIYLAVTSFLLLPMSLLLFMGYPQPFAAWETAFDFLMAKHDNL